MIKKIFALFSETHFLFSLVGLISGVIYVSITPPLWGTDETSHFARVYQLAHGEILPHMNLDGYGGSIPKNLYDLNNYTQSDLMDNKGGGVISRKDVNNADGYKQFTDKPFSKDKHSFLWTASYSPVAYAGSIVGVIIANFFNASIGTTIFLARLGSLFVYVALIGFAIRLLRGSRLKWLIFTAALIPVSLYQASVVTADSMAIALSMLFISAFVRLLQYKSDEKVDNGVLWALVAAAILLPLVKINYIFLSFGVFLVPNRIFRSNKVAAISKLASLGVATVLGLVWTSIVRPTSSPPISQRPDGAKTVAADQIALILHHPLHFIEACIRSVVLNIDSYVQSMASFIGWNYVSMPLIFTIILCFGIFFSALYAKKELREMRGRLAILNICTLIGVISIFAALYIAFNPTGNRVVDGIQGRYFLPLILPFILLLASFTPIEVRIKEKLSPLIFGIISSSCLAVSVLYYLLATY